MKMMTIGTILSVNYQKALTKEKIKPYISDEIHALNSEA
jgi:hypothetical protein